MKNASTKTKQTWPWSATVHVSYILFPWSHYPWFKYGCTNRLLLHGDPHPTTVSHVDRVLHAPDERP
jgi:hypothetical protein